MTARGEVVRGPWPDRVDEEAFFRTQVPDGTYLVAYCGHNSAKRWGRQLYDIIFQIIEPVATAQLIDAAGCEGLHVVHFVNRPRAGKKLSLRGTLAMDFRRIVGLLPPQDLHRLDPRLIYGGCTLEARVRAIARDSQGEAIPEGARYSSVQKIIRRIDGAPLYLVRRKGPAA